MKATELMIGDWVYRPDCYDKVVEVRKDTILGSDPLRGLIPIADLQPIPLTAEILEENDIKWLMSEPSGKKTYSCNEPPISCTSSPDRGWYLSAGPVGSTKLPFAEISKAYYVHELQHVIRDAKVEKEIIL